MKITSVEPLIVNAMLRNWIFVRIETDSSDLYGWGEATMEWKTNAVVGAIKDLSPLLLGQDPRRIEYLWQSMHRHQYFRGGAVTMSAISGIDQALHDIVSKSLEVPLYQLLGGAVRERVRMYDHLGGGQTDAVYAPADPEFFSQSAAKSVSDGFTALKMLAIGPGESLVNQDQVEHAATVMAAVRETVGTSVDIMIDLHGRTSPAAALAYGRAMAKDHPWFFEEPCAPGDPVAMAEVARALAIPVATGERLVTRREFLELFTLRACSVIQPDICHCGGFTEIRKVAALAEMHQVGIAPHNPLGPIATAMSLHFAFASPAHLIQEVMRSDVPWRDGVVSGGLPIEDGFVTLPDVIGSGMDVNVEDAMLHPYIPEPQLAAINSASGAVLDW